MKIKSLELPSGLIVNFQDGGKILIVRKNSPNSEDDDLITIHINELETIRDTCRSNARAENLSKESAGGNGEIVKTKKEEKAV